MAAFPGVGREAELGKAVNKITFSDRIKNAYVQAAGKKTPSGLLSACRTQPGPFLRPFGDEAGHGHAVSGIPAGGAAVAVRNRPFRADSKRGKGS